MAKGMEDLRAQINLSGLSRREAARALYLSTSALNRKLRGEIGMSPEEKEKLLALLNQRGKRGP